MWATMSLQDPSSRQGEINRIKMGICLMMIYKKMDLIKFNIPLLGGLTMIMMEIMEMVQEITKTKISREV